MVVRLEAYMGSLSPLTQALLPIVEPKALQVYLTLTLTDLENNREPEKVQPDGVGIHWLIYDDVKHHQYDSIMASVYTG